MASSAGAGQTAGNTRTRPQGGVLGAVRSQELGDFRSFCRPEPPRYSTWGTSCDSEMFPALGLEKGRSESGPTALVDQAVRTEREGLRGQDGAEMPFASQPSPEPAGHPLPTLTCVPCHTKQTRTRTLAFRRTHWHTRARCSPADSSQGVHRSRCRAGQPYPCPG